MEDYFRVRTREAHRREQLRHQRVGRNRGRQCLIVVVVVAHAELRRQPALCVGVLHVDRDVQQVVIGLTVSRHLCLAVRGGQRAVVAEAGRERATAKPPVCVEP